MQRTFISGTKELSFKKLQQLPFLPLWLSCVPPNSHGGVLPPSISDVTVFGARAFKKVNGGKVRSRVWP